MNTIRIRTGLFCAVIASLAASAAVARKAEPAEGDRVEHITRQGVHREQRHVNNAPNQAPPQVVPPRHSPPASVPRPPAANPPRGDNRGNHNGGQKNGNGHNNGGPNNDGHNNGGQNNDGGYNNGGHNNNGGYYAGGRNPHFVPPPRYNNPKGNGHAPRYDYSPGRGHSPRYAYSPSYGHSHRYVRPPRYVTTLPAGYRRHNWNGNPYYYHSGYWYRPNGASYVVAAAPYGLYVPYLSSYSSLWFGSTRYYYSEGNYYNYEPARRGYVVARSPYVESDNDAEDLYFYPAQGQGEQQQTDDRYECHRWAVDQAQYDPVDSTYDGERRSDYDRAITACMTGRGYSVS